jgi:hypothetical protein
MDTPTKDKPDRWPRGKFNGQRVVGVVCTIKVDITQWDLRWFGSYGACACIGPIRIWVGWNYEDSWKTKR